MKKGNTEIFNNSVRLRNWGLDKLCDWFRSHSKPDGVKSKLGLLTKSTVALLWYLALQIQFSNWCFVNI